MMHITEEQVRQTLPMPKAIELVEQCFRRLGGQRAVNHPRQRITLENRSTLHYMAAGDNDSGYLGTKVYVTGPAGAHFVVLLFAQPGELVASIEANALGQIRTGAASGVATRHLAREDSGALGLIGSGFQAQTQLEAVAAVRELRQVKVFSRGEENRKRFAQVMGPRLGLEIEAVNSAQSAVSNADIVVTVTSARQPVLEGGWLPPGCHINAAGSNHARRRELDGAAVERCGVITADSVEQAKMEAGDLIEAAEEGRLDWSRVRELSHIVSGRAAGRSSLEEITLFESQGLAIEDVAVAAHVYESLRDESRTS